MVSGTCGAIIAAGRGERLRAGVAGVSKPLVDIGGEILLARQARLMLESGIRSVHAVVNSETARSIEQCKLALPPELSLLIRDTPNSMESLFALREQISTARFLLATVDTIVAPGEFIRFAHTASQLTDPPPEKALDGALAVTRWRGDKGALFATLSTDGRISRVGGDEGELVTAGLYLFSTRIFDFAGKAGDARLDALRRFLALLLDEGLRLGAIEISGAIDIDEPADLEAARAIVRSLG
ncbi:MAG: NTP transferase domain-containing protein [Candidatus Binataceae bacterium]